MLIETRNRDKSGHPTTHLIRDQYFHSVVCEAQDFLPCKILGQRYAICIALRILVTDEIAQGSVWHTLLILVSWISICEFSMLVFA